MDLNGILVSLPIIATIVGVVSGTITVLLHVFGHYLYAAQFSAGGG